MYRHYGRGEAAWPAAARRARDFIAGTLHRHLVTWPRHGRLGVPADLNAPALCALLPRLIDEHGEFGLLGGAEGDRLLVLPVHAPRELSVLCYGPWPGIETWESCVEPELPRGATLLHTRWNVMPVREGIRLVPPASPRPAWKAGNLGVVRPITSR